MTNYGKVRATTCPDAVVIDDLSVWVAENVAEVTVSLEEDTHTEYEYDLTQYSKDEYIRMMDERNEALETQVNDTMLALCELYEMMQ